MSITIDKTAWQSFVPIALPVWVTGLLIDLPDNSNVWYSLFRRWLYLDEIRDRYGAWVGLLTLVFFALWFHEEIWLRHLRYLPHRAREAIRELANRQNRGKLK